MIDLELDRMYATGALNTYIAELSEWIAEKEAAIEKHKDKTYMLPVIESLQKHIDEARSLLGKAENYHAGKQANKG